MLYPYITIRYLTELRRPCNSFVTLGRCLRLINCVNDKKLTYFDDLHDEKITVLEKLQSRMQNIILGLDESQLITHENLCCKLQSPVIDALLQLVQRAQTAGFELKVASSYRSFERQLLIWNNKARGLRPVLDDQGAVIDLKKLSAREKVFAILRWSALPGASRHHWGTDLDIYDASRISSDYQVQLTVAETQGDGPFAEFHCWLSKEVQRPDCNFYRPYAFDSGGIAPEPWHLSYAPLAKQYAAALTEDILRAQLTCTDIELKDTILENLSSIYARFVRTE